MRDGWGKIAKAANHAGVSERTFRKWLKLGLQQSRLESGTILVKFSEIDLFLDQFSVKDSANDAIDRIADEVIKAY